MGSSPSRPSRRARPDRPKRAFISSLFICGGSTSHSPGEVEDDPSELLGNSLKHTEPVAHELCSSTKESSLATAIESRASCESCNLASEESAFEDCLTNFETNNLRKPLCTSKELVHPQPSADHRINDTASTSYEHQPLSDAGSANVGSNADHINGIDIMDKNESHLFAEDRDPRSSSLQADEVSVVSDVSDSVNSSPPVSSQLLRDDVVQEIMPSGSGFLASSVEQNGRSGNVLHLDVVSISSSNLSSSNNSEIAINSDTRRNSRRLFWDAFSRRSSRRHNVDTQTFVFSTDDNDGLGSHDRWLLDFGGSLLHDGIESDSGYMRRRSRNHGMNEWPWHSRSEMRERVHDGGERVNAQTGICPSGLHSDGTCSCAAVLMDGSSTGASVSRIVILAEELFEVLDEIYRQPLTLSLSVVSLPAPEAVVDSFPVKYHKQPDKPVTADDAARCYICLSDYEESDKIRVLPCHHEFHLSCVDKWLKEMHGVCPLCRGDVREGFAEEPVSNSESSLFD